jgi:hypothetical protein
MRVLKVIDASWFKIIDIFRFGGLGLDLKALTISSYVLRGCGLCLKTRWGRAGGYRGVPGPMRPGPAGDLFDFLPVCNRAILTPKQLP